MHFHFDQNSGGYGIAFPEGSPSGERRRLRLCPAWLGEEPAGEQQGKGGEKSLGRARRGEASALSPRGAGGILSQRRRGDGARWEVACCWRWEDGDHLWNADFTCLLPASLPSALQQPGGLQRQAGRPTSLGARLLERWGPGDAEGWREVLSEPGCRCGEGQQGRERGAWMHLLPLGPSTPREGCGQAERAGTRAPRGQVAAPAARLSPRRTASFPGGGPWWAH